MPWALRTLAGPVSLDASPRVVPWFRRRPSSPRSTSVHTSIRPRHSPMTLTTSATFPLFSVWATLSLCTWHDEAPVEEGGPQSQMSAMLGQSRLISPRAKLVPSCSSTRMHDTIATLKLLDIIIIMNEMEHPYDSTKSRSNHFGSQEFEHTCVHLTW